MFEEGNYKPEIMRDSVEESIQHHKEMVGRFQKMKEMISSFTSFPDQQNETEWYDKKITEHQERIKQLKGEKDER